jgi:hypothetical protein
LEQLEHLGNDKGRRIGLAVGRLAIGRFELSLQASGFSPGRDDRGVVVLRRRERFPTLDLTAREVIGSCIPEPCSRLDERDEQPLSIAAERFRELT